MLPTLTVSRNEITKTLETSTFGKKSPNAGKEFYVPRVGMTTFDEDMKWIGLDEVMGMVNRSLRTTFADIFNENLEENGGVFNAEKFAADAANFSAGVQKLQEVDDQLDELQAEQQKYALDDEFGATDGEGKPTPRAVELQKLITQNAEKIKPLRLKKAEIQALYADRVAKREKKKQEAELAAAKAKLESAGQVAA